MTSYSYVGRKKCGCLVAACVDTPDHAKDVAKFVASMIRDGLTVERVDSDVVRIQFTTCYCEEKEESEQPKLL